MEISSRPIQLSDDDKAHHVALVRRVVETREKAARVQAAWQEWAEYLQERYGFTENDVIAEDGTISYGSARLNGVNPDDEDGG